MAWNLWRCLFLAALLLQACWRGASREQEFYAALGLDAGFPSCAALPGSGERALCTLRAATRAVRDVADAARGGAGGDGGGDVDTCRFRRERGAGLHRYATEAIPDLQAVLREYAEMHASCTALERGRLREMAGKGKKRSASGGSTPTCKYLVWSCTFGLGNKLMSLTSAFLHAVLSQRVLLVDHPGWEALWCEPFPGSRWQVPPGFSLAEDYESPSFSSFRARQCGGARNGKGRRGRRRGGASSAGVCDADVVSVVFSSDMNATDYGFQVCPSEMARVRDVAFLNFRNSNQHFAAGYYLNPAVRPLLELLFPDRNVFHLLARAILHPGDQVWSSVDAFHREYLSGAVRRIGVQVREFKGEYHAYYDQAAPLCIQAKSGLCPIEVEEALERAAAGSGANSTANREYVSVFMASLENRHVALLRSSMGKLEEDTGMRFRLFSQDGDGEQMDDIGHLKKALVDMWVLSLSDVLMTSHMSTFGYFAHGVSGLVPYQLKPWADNPCWLGASSEPCFHFGPRKVACRADGFRIDDPFKELPFLKPCPDMPRTGLQVVAGIY